MNAGPRKGRTARNPRRSPLSDLSAALRTRSSPGSAPPTRTWGSAATTDLTALTATVANPLDEYRPGQAKWDAHVLAFDPDLDRAFVFTRRQDLDVGAGHQPAAVQFAQPAG